MSNIKEVSRALAEYGLQRIPYGEEFLLWQDDICFSLLRIRRLAEGFARYRDWDSRDEWRLFNDKEEYFYHEREGLLDWILGHLAKPDEPPTAPLRTPDA